jgi:hypothetical protein
VRPRDGRQGRLAVVHPRLLQLGREGHAWMLVEAFQSASRM